MPKNELITEFMRFLEDPILRSWVQAYLEGNLEADDLVEAALGTLEQENEAEEN
jgi:hypothetical protein